MEAGNLFQYLTTLIGKTFSVFRRRLEPLSTFKGIHMLESTSNKLVNILCIYDLGKYMTLLR